MSGSHDDDSRRKAQSEDRGVIAMLVPIGISGPECSNDGSGDLEMPDQHALDTLPLKVQELTWYNRSPYKRKKNWRATSIGWTCAVLPGSDSPHENAENYIQLGPRPQKTISAEEEVCYFRVNMVAGRMELQSLCDHVEYQDNGVWKYLPKCIGSPDTCGWTPRAPPLYRDRLVLASSRYRLRFFGCQVWEFVYSRASNHQTILSQVLGNYLRLKAENTEEEYIRKAKGIKFKTEVLSDIVMPMPNFEDLELKSFLGCTLSDSRLVHIRRITIRNKEELSDIQGLRAMMKRWKGVYGVHGILGIGKIDQEVFCEHLADEWDHSPCAILTVHPPHIGSFFEIDWLVIDRYTRNALFRQSARGLYFLHEEDHVHGQGPDTIHNILVQSVGTHHLPKAMIAGFRKSQSNDRVTINQEKQDDVQQWTIAVCLVISMRHHYHWCTTAQMIDGLERHARLVPKDEPLSRLLRCVLEERQIPLTRSDNYTMGRILNDTCWDDLISEAKTRALYKRDDPAASNEEQVVERTGYMTC